MTTDQRKAWLTHIGRPESLANHPSFEVVVSKHVLEVKHNPKSPKDKQGNDTKYLTSAELQHMKDGTEAENSEAKPSSEISEPDSDEYATDNDEPWQVPRYHRKKDKLNTSLPLNKSPATPNTPRRNKSERQLTKGKPKKPVYTFPLLGVNPVTGQLEIVNTESRQKLGKTGFALEIPGVTALRPQPHQTMEGGGGRRKRRISRR